MHPIFTSKVSTANFKDDLEMTFKHRYLSLHEIMTAAHSFIYIIGFLQKSMKN